MRGEADLLLCMEEKNDPLHKLIPETSRLPLGHETLVPLSAPGKKKRALHTPQADKPLNLLAFPPDSFLGRAMHERIRSEEHTSELQSLMRNSYAVFCLKKKK